MSDLRIECYKTNDWCHLIRRDVLEALERYVFDRIAPGSFLEAVLLNNLSEAIGQADEQNYRTLKYIVAHVYNCLPAQCWGVASKSRCVVTREASWRRSSYLNLVE